MSPEQIKKLFPAQLVDDSPLMDSATISLIIAKRNILKAIEIHPADSFESKCKDQTVKALDWFLEHPSEFRAEIVVKYQPSTENIWEEYLKEKM